jgi:hypothetical protein
MGEDHWLPAWIVVERRSRPDQSDFWLRTVTSSAVVSADHNKYDSRLENWWLWATYKLGNANVILDRIGLDKKDADGYRASALIARPGYGW